MAEEDSERCFSCQLLHLTVSRLRTYILIRCGRLLGLQHEDSGRIRCVLPDVHHYNADADSVVLKVFSKCYAAVCPCKAAFAADRGAATQRKTTRVTARVVLRVVNVYANLC